MSRTSRFQFFWTALLLCVVPFAFVACSEDSPTQPTQNPPPTGGTAPVAWVITVTATPNSVSLETGQSSVIQVDVRRPTSGAPPADGTRIRVDATANTGSFTSTGQVDNVTLTLTGGQAATRFYPSGIGGTAVITARLEGSLGQAVLAIRGIGDFFVERINPDSGNPQGDEGVGIIGGGFVAPVKVEFGSRQADVRSVTPTLIRVRTPPNPLPAGTEFETVDVTITNAVGANEASATVGSGFTYTTLGDGNTPRVFSIEPPSGPNEGGTTVLIRGDGFDAPVQVLFGEGTAAAEATVLSTTSTEIRVSAPPATGLGIDNQNQTVAVTVRNLDSGRSFTFDNGFTYGPTIQVFAVSPPSGPATGGTPIEISGQGFADPLQVTIGNAEAVVGTVTSGTINATTGALTDVCTDETFDVKVTKTVTGEVAIGEQLFTYIARAPTLDGVSPTSGSVNGGTALTLTGENLSSGLRVTFQGAETSASANMNSGTGGSGIVVAPAFTPETSTCGANGVMAEATVVTLTVRDLASGCGDSLTNAYTYQPSDTTCLEAIGNPTGSSGAQQLDFSSASSTGNITNYLWDFGDTVAGDTATAANPSYTYTRPSGDNATVTLTVFNADGLESTHTFNVSVP